MVSGRIWIYPLEMSDGFVERTKILDILQISNVLAQEKQVSLVRQMVFFNSSPTASTEG